MTEKLKLEIGTFDNILGMLNSPDKENLTVAMECIENVDFKENLTYIVMLKKISNVTSDIWKTHAPETYKNLERVGATPEKPSTYKDILQIITKYKVPDADIQFYCDKFGSHLKSEIKKMGYDLVDEVVITLQLKSKTNEPITIGTASEGQ